VCVCWCGVTFACCCFVEVDFFEDILGVAVVKNELISVSQYKEAVEEAVV